MLPPAISWVEGHLRLLDQRSLPTSVEFIDCERAEDVAVAIKTLAVRGAPAIGIAAAYGVALEARTGRSQAVAACDRLALTRPTAVNLFWALRRVRERMETVPDSGLFDAVLGEAAAIHEEDREGNISLGRAGADLLPDDCRVLTHCNAGALATGGHGTALGIVRSARDAGKRVKVYACETRPLLQGARLTVWELVQDGIDTTLVCDSMSASLMSSGRLDAVIVGADRIAANGDTANKIGTCTHAVLASHFGIPFYVAAPLSTFDRSLTSGDAIPIEERSADEVRRLPSGGMLPDYYSIWNPAFDVTRASLITAIITEKGVILPPFGEGIASLLSRQEV